MKRYFLTYILLIISTLHATAQAGRFYTPDGELSNSLVNHVYQDKKGFVWIATEDGLNRFDGSKFTVYRHSADDPASMPDNYVRSVLEDNKGNFWVGSMNGLSRYDRATDSFRRIEMWRQGRLVNPHVKCIIETIAGEIWIATSGMGLFVVRDGSAETILEADLTSNYLEWLLEDSRGRMWIATEDSGMNMYDPATDSIRAYRAPDRIGGDKISSVVEDRAGRIFVGTLTRGLHLYDRQEDRFVEVPYEGRGPLFVKSLTVRDDNLMYVGTDGQGLKVYNPAEGGGGRIEDFDIKSAPFDFSRGKVHSILHDRDGNLWLGMFQKGVMLIPGAEKRFDYWGFKSLVDNPVGSSAVMSVHRDRAGVVWVGTDGEGLYGVDESGRQVAHFAPGTSPVSVPGVILSIFEDSRGDFWVGSYMNGLAKVDRRTGRCEYIPELSTRKIYSIAEDGHGNLLLGTYGAGFYKMRLSDRRLTHYESTKREDGDFKVDAIANDWINDIILDSDGMVWLAHFNGVSCYDPERNTFLNYLGQNTILPSVVAYDLCEDSSGRIWIGAIDGVWVFDRRDRSIRHYTTADGLPGNVACGVLEDAEGNMWISTYMGLSKFDAHQNRFMNYYAGDGLQGNEFTRGASWGGGEGRMYFGGIYGVTSFLPAEITEDRKVPEVLITGFYIDDRPVRVGDRSGSHTVTDVPVPDADRFRMSHSDNTFSIEFSALEFADPESIKYQYRIEELGAEWINSYRGAGRATWTNLAPGTYTFTVRALDNENVSVPRSIRVTIDPPWFRSWWAYVIYAGLAGLFAWFIWSWVRARVARRTEEQRRLQAEQINEAKLQFFTNISHEIRTPMTLIMNPVEKLIAESNDPVTQKTYLTIHRNAQRILRLINQMMDIRKLDKRQIRLHFRETEMVGFIEELMLTFEYLARRKNLLFNFVHPDESLYAWIDPENFDKVLINVLFNAFKYTSDNGNVTIELRGDGTWFTITVTDSGIGIDESELENIFERFYRVNNEQTNANFGTGIGMHLARSLVELHHGTITASGRGDTPGTTFTIRLPMGSDHLSAEEMDTDSDRPTTAPEASQSPEARSLAGAGAGAGAAGDAGDAGDAGGAGAAGAASDDGRADEPTPAKARSKTRYRVLVADDESEIRDYIHAELSPWFRMSEVADGKSALEAILGQMPDLVISDVMMPGMDGVELVRRMKQNININHIPVILLTARAAVESRLEGLDVGADAYITKPFDTGVLRSTVMNLIENRERLRNSFAGQQLIEDMTRRIELKSVDEQLMERVMDFINENISNSELSVEILASGVGMSRVHLHRRLKYLTGQSASDFIKGIRLRQAASLLSEGKFAISEVAYATGFSNLSHFSNSFKEFFGLSPTAYVNKPS